MASFADTEPDDTAPEDTTLQAFIAQLQPIQWNRWGRLEGKNARIRRDFNERWNLEKFFEWPPDMFGLTSSILQTTGAYRATITPPADDFKWPPVGWQIVCREKARGWLAWMSGASESNPMESYCETLKSESLKRVLIRDLYDIETMAKGEEETKKNAVEVCRTLLELHAISDEAMRGVGTLYSPRTSFTSDAAPREPGWPPVGLERIHLQANLLLVCKGSLSRLGKHRGTVLPRTRASQVGHTLRSFSHNLTFHRSEVDVAWRAVPWMNLTESTLNALIVPWPYKINARSFHSALRPETFEELGDERYFTYKPTGSAVTTARSFAEPGSALREPKDDDSEATPRVETLDGDCTTPDQRFDPRDIAARVRQALVEARQVHLLIFPEAALSVHDLKELQRVLSVCIPKYAMPLIIAGVCDTEDDRRNGDSAPSAEPHRFNRAVLSYYSVGKWFTMQQDKHHRWKLDDSQIATYDLGGVLSGARDSWESIAIPRRRISFITSNAWMTIAPLICEDLARLDPVSDLIRGVGPTLLVALLQDGPQLPSRWPGRYASVFADDPGTAVLTVTSLGMCRRSIPPETRYEGVRDAREKSKGKVALWKDPLQGWREIWIGRPHPAALLMMVTQWGRTRTSDARVDGESPTFRYQGIHTPKPPREVQKWVDTKMEPHEPPKASGEKPEAETSGAPRSEPASTPLPPSRIIYRDNLLDITELTIYTFFLDALVDLACGDDATEEKLTGLLNWMLVALGVRALEGEIDATPPDSEDTINRSDTDIQRHIREALATRRSLPVEIPTPHLLLALHAAAELVQAALNKASLEATRDYRGVLAALFEVAHDKLTGEDPTWLLDQWSLKEIRSTAATSEEVISELSRRSHFAHNDASRRGEARPAPTRLNQRAISIPVHRVGRILYGSPQKLLWAIHNRLAILRRNGKLASRDAILLNEVENFVRKPYDDAFLDWYLKEKAKFNRIKEEERAAGKLTRVEGGDQALVPRL